MTDVPGLFFVDAPPAPETFNVLLWGEPKSGKSTAAATAPGPILWVNAEGPGALGFARQTAAARGTVIHEVLVQAKGGTPPGDVLLQVWEHLKSGAEPKVQTVVVDTLAKVRDALVEQFVAKNTAKSLQQYGVVADKLGGFIKALRDLPVNVVLLAHVDQSEDPEDGRRLKPLIGGKLTETVPGDVDVVAYTSPFKSEDGVVYVGQLVDGKGRFGLGDRSGSLAGDLGYRRLDLSEWLAAYRAALTPDDSDLPFSLTPEAAETAADGTGDTGAGDDPEAQQTLADAA